ncbi:3D domain-containing protein [Neobacillus bataviensis LMG 21833]|uniref:3D domain-containing protein n=1 Tax=Neobacillus bataviensis LMG 21833 TaxID=1117379 RepID=K6DEM4_9BACI|nr:3D domain-containing protein [Neobacillus bataviensis]EKN66503.1 3D domain-containing protein [Neobacillus bataviensis LMG 21833]
MQTTRKRIILVLLTMMLCVSGSMVTYAQSNSDALHNAQQQLQEKDRLVEQKVQEQQSVNKEIQNIKQELESVLNEITKNKEEMAKSQAKIDETNKLIEAKKEEIVVLEDKMLARQDIMKKRAVAMQQNSNVNLIVNLFFESDSISDFIQRASAASTLMDADKDILTAQKADLKQIEKDKEEIDRQEKVLEEGQKALAAQQAALDQNMQKRQQSLTVMQEKFNQIAQQVALAEKEKSGLENQMRNIQASISAEQEAASARVAAVSVSSTPPQENSGAATNGKEMYVTATAYTPFDGGTITSAGYNIAANPNMKLIAVDPSVIPMGSKVWVEGYGVAIAGDTGGAIKGHRIDILLPTKAAAYSWGRKTVKVVILN